VFPSMTKGEIVGRLVAVIDVNPSHGFWTVRLIKVFGHEDNAHAYTKPFN
jgi:hypothetical protein